MRVYQLSSESDAFRQLAFENTSIEDLIMNDYHQGNDIPEGAQFKWSEDTINQPISDCQFIGSIFKIFSNRIIKHLITCNLINGIDYRKIIVDGEEYYLTRTTNLLSNIIDNKNSKISYFPDGRIMCITKYAFCSEFEFPNWFTVAEFPFYIFVNEKVKIELDKINPLGLKMNKCYSRT